MVVTALLAVVAILVLWKKNDRALAIAELEQRFGAELSIDGGEFLLGVASPELEDLKEFATIVARVGEPTLLDLTGAPALRSLAGIERLPSLTSLVAIDCPSLVSAEGVAGLPNLIQLSFIDSANFVDTSAIRHLPSLLSLDLSGCAKLQRLELAELPSLENLYLSRCRKLEGLDVTAFPRLHQLSTDGCAGLTSIAGLDRLVELTDLDVSNANALDGLPGIEGLRSLIVLDIRNVDLTDFRGIAALPNLRVLRMGGQAAIETLEVFSPLTSLRELHLEACPNFRSLKGIPPGLTQYAGFTHCTKLLSLDGVEGAQGLEQLDLTGCENLGEISALAKLDQLVQLSLVKCRQVDRIDAAVGLPKLVIVMLGGSGVVPASVEKLKPANEDLIFDFAVAE